MMFFVVGVVIFLIMLALHLDQHIKAANTKKLVKTYYKTYWDNK